MGSKVLILIFLGVLSTTFGGPELSSSTSSLELSGEVCPGYITLTCSKNTTERIIVWYINDIELARFDEEDVAPFTIKTRPDLFNATVQVTSVVEVNRYFSFDDFTLTARVSDFLPLQGQNLTCGTLLDRSEPFRVNNFFLEDFENAENLRLMIVRDGNNEMLSVKWNITNFKCAETNYNFVGTLNNGTNQLFETTTACSLNCEVRFPLVSPEDSYIIEVSPLNRQGERVGDSVVTNFSANAADVTHSSTYELTQSTCIVSIKCISPVTGNCLIKITNRTETIVSINDTFNFQDLTPSAIYMLNITFIELSLEIKNKNISIEGSCGSSTSTGVVVGVVVAIVVLVLVLVTVTVIIIIWVKKPHKKKATGHGEMSQAEKTIEFHSIDTESIQFNDRGMSNVEDNIQQAHKSVGERSLDAILREREKVTTAAYAIKQKETQVCDDTEQVKCTKIITNNTKVTISGSGKMYFQSNSVCLTYDDYSSLQHNTTGAQGQCPIAAFILHDEHHEQLNSCSLECDENNETNHEVTERDNQRNIKQSEYWVHRKAHQH